jgi:hypothetical protein
MRERFFIRPNPGCILPRYFIMHPTRNAFVRVLISYPDGVEIREPAGVCDQRPAPTATSKVRPALDRGGQFRISERAWVRALGDAFCTRCKGIKPIGDFPTRDRAVSGLSSWCRTCSNTSNSAKRVRIRAAADPRS